MADASSRRFIWIWAGGLALSAVAAYHNSFSGPFVFDDIPAIADNPSLRHGWDLNALLAPDAGYGISVSGRPVLGLSLALCAAISGQQVWSYHVFNLLGHVFAGLALFGVVRRTLLRLERWSRDSTTLAGVIALLWVVHPLQTEAVTYIIQRSESLMALFVLLTLYAFIRSVDESRPWKWRTIAIVACLAGDGSKEVAAVAPILVLLYDRTFIAGTLKEAWRRRRGFHLTLAATLIPLALLVARTGWNRGGTSGFNVGASAMGYWLTQFKAVAVYLKLAVWPHPLVIDHGTFWMNAEQAAPFSLVVLPLLAATVWALWRRPALGFLGAAFFLVLAPTSLVPGLLQMIVEHRMYLPLATVITAVVLCVHALGKSRAVLACGALAVPLGVLTVQRNDQYRDDLTLWEAAVSECPGSELAQSNLGTALFQRHRVTEAFEHFRIAASLAPDRAQNRYNLGVAYAAFGNWNESAAEEEAAVRLNPAGAAAFYQLGVDELALHRTPEALAALDKAVAMMPSDPRAHYERGAAFSQMGRWADPAEEDRATLKLDRRVVDAENDLGTALFQLNQVADAAEHFRNAVKLNPDLPQAHFNLGLALERLGATDDSNREYAETVRLSPDNAAAQFKLGIALATQGRLTEAIEHLSRGVALMPDSAAGHYELGVALAQSGRGNDALTQFESAVHLDPNFEPAKEMLRRLQVSGP